MSSVSVTGQVVHVSKEQVVSDKFRKLEVVVCVSNGRYDDYIKFEVVNDGIKMLDNIKVLDEVTAVGYVQGRKWVDAHGETKYMTTLRLRSIMPPTKVVGNAILDDIEDAPF
jgi:hypothetical protein